MLFQEGPNQIISYELVNVDTGEWSHPKILEYPFYANKSFVGHLTLRIHKVISKLATNIEKSMTAKYSTRITNSHQFLTLFDTSVKELKKHEYACSTFSDTIVRVLEDNSSFEECQKKLKNTIFILSKVENCWIQIMGLYTEKHAHQIIENMKEIKFELDSFCHDEHLQEIYEAFLHIDDATRGLLRVPFNDRVAIHPAEASEKFIDCIVRRMIKGINAYRGSDESKLVVKAFQKIEELNVVKTYYVELLHKVHTKLESSLEGTYECLF